MITQTNVQGPESNSSDIIKDMSPQTNIHAPSFEDDEFEIPAVNIIRFFNDWLARLQGRTIDFLIMRLFFLRLMTITKYVLFLYFCPKEPVLSITIKLP